MVKTKMHDDFFSSLVGISDDEIGILLGVWHYFTWHLEFCSAILKTGTNFLAISICNDTTM